MRIRMLKGVTYAMAFTLAACGSGQDASSQTSDAASGEINNLVHEPGYETQPLGALGEVIERGDGPVNLIMVTGGGLPASIFEDFFAANADRFTMYGFTTPGYGGTAAPPMPDAGTPWMARSWSSAFEQSIVDFIRARELENVVLLGHFLGATHALHIAADNPDLIDRVVLVAAEPARGRLTPNLESQVAGMADNWFRGVSEQQWREGNFVPALYSRSEERAQEVWDIVEIPPVPVNVRYLVEFFASDILGDVSDYSVPTLVLLPDFDDSVPPTTQDFFTGSWGAFRQRGGVFAFEQIEDAHVLMWEDNPDATYAAINRFIEE